MAKQELTYVFDEGVLTASNGVNTTSIDAPGKPLICLECWVKCSANDILKYYFLIFSQKLDFGISGKETICMKYQSLFSGKNIINLSPENGKD